MKFLKLIPLIVIIFIQSFASFKLIKATPPLEHELNTSYELTIISDDEIKLNKEVITFDFNKTKTINNDIFAFQKGEYELINPNEQKIVKIGLPIIAKYNDELLEDVEFIVNDNELLNPRYYYGDLKDYVVYEQIDFKNLEATFYNNDFAFNNNQIGTFYTLNTSSNKSTINITLAPTQKIICQNLNYINNNGHITLYYDSEKSLNETATFYVFGETNQPVVSDGELIGEQMTYNEFLLRYSQIIDYNESMNFLANIFQKFLNYQYYQVSNDDFILNEINSDRLILVVYDVELYGLNTINYISTSCYVQGSIIDYYTPPKYEFTYMISNDNWLSKNNLVININIAKNYRYATSFSLDFNNDEDGNYSASLEGQPELVKFEICASSSPFHHPHPLQLVLIGFLLFIIIAIIIGLISLIKLVKAFFPKRKSELF